MTTQQALKEIPARDLYPVPEAGVLLGISKRKIWDLVWNGQLETRWIEGRRLVPRQAITDFISALPVAKPKIGRSAK